MASTLEAAKKAFFDRTAVIEKLDPAVKRALSKFGAFVRQRSRTSIRDSKGTSKPGNPPFSHTKTLKRFILFGYDPGRKSVVIGPTLAGSASGAPEALEEGGTAVVVQKAKRRVVTIRPRPYMKPAFNAELARVGNNFKNLIR